MLIEVALLQRFVLLLGHPVYSLTVTLFSLLARHGPRQRVEPPRIAQRSASDAPRCSRACAVAVVALLWGSVLPAIVQAAIALAARPPDRPGGGVDDAGRHA